MILPRFITVPLAAFGTHPDPHVTAGSGPPDYPPIAHRNPAQWFDAWKYPGYCPPVPPWCRCGPRRAPARSHSAGPPPASTSTTAFTCGGRASQVMPRPPPTQVRRATITGLRPGPYRAKVVPVNFYQHAGPAAEVTFTIP